jgi:uncharacterized membrane protein YdjX (TVP38/TMEM64 family)
VSVPLRSQTRDWNANTEKVRELSLGAGDEKPPERRRSALVTGGLIALVVLAGYIAWRWLEVTGGVGALFDRFGPFAPLVSIPVHVLLSATPFPSELIGVANGSVYGLWLGTTCSWIGWWCGAALEYTLVRRGAREIEWTDAANHLPGWLRRFPVGHPVFLIVGRQLPFGFHTVNVLAGLAGVSPRRQLICSAISNLPYAFLSAAAGAGLIAAGTG